jgi:uncharacterized Zn-finger protein
MYETISKLTASLMFREAKEQGTNVDTTTQKKKNQILECSWCDKTFQGQAALKIHMRTHIYCRRTHSCSMCAKSFAPTNALCDTDWRLLKCSQCQLSFRQSTHLKMHIKTHCEEQPHKCSKCCQSFRWSVSLRRHMRTQHSNIS